MIGLHVSLPAQVSEVVQKRRQVPGGWSPWQPKPVAHSTVVLHAPPAGVVPWGQTQALPFPPTM